MNNNDRLIFQNKGIGGQLRNKMTEEDIGEMDRLELQDKKILVTDSRIK